MDENKFGKASVPVAMAAKVYGKDASWVRAGIISGWLPIGKATRNGKLITDLKEMNSKNSKYWISKHNKGSFFYIFKSCKNLQKLEKIEALICVLSDFI